MNAIAECIRIARKADLTEVQAAPTRVTEIGALIVKAEERKRTLFGVEKNVVAPLNAKIKELHDEKERFSCLSRFGQFPQLDLSSLSLRDEHGWPRVALIGLDSPKVQFAVIGTYGNLNQWSRRFQPTLPKPLRDCYMDVMEALRKLAIEKKQSAFLATEYVGLIPESTRQKIITAKESFDEVFILAEVEDWDLSFETVPKPRPRKVDPLIVGFDGKNLWVVDHFDLTPVEQYIKDEFCV